MEPNALNSGSRKRASHIFVLVAVFLVANTIPISHSMVRNSAGAPKFTVEVVQVGELPVSVGDVVLKKTRKGYELKCLLTNNSADRIVRIDYLLLVIDSNNVARHLVNGTEDFELKSYATKALNSETHLRLEVSDGYRLFLIPNRVSSRESVWEVLKAKKALEAHASGDYSVMPEVVRGSNLYDAPPRFRIIY